jgi:hypothetical protein
MGRNVFTYVKDIVVASKNKEDHLLDLAETFANMREARLRLNLEKCIFGVCQGKILGYLVSHRGIEANPNKIQAIMDMAVLQSTKDIQRLTGRLAALNICNIQLVICMRLYQRRNDNSFICMCVIYIYHFMRTSHENK